MQSTIVRQAAAKAKRSDKSVLAHLMGRGQDLVGPPDPLTNLRPVYYAPRFVAPSPVSRTKKLHPYQLDEFGSSASPAASSALASTSSAAALPAALSLSASARRKQAAARERLERLRRRFEAEDLEWRLQRRRLDQISHEHWARSNLAFQASKDAAEQRAIMVSSSTVKPSKQSTSQVSNQSSQQQQQQYDPYVMEEFHRNWVENRSRAFEEYQRDWVAGLFAQLRPAARALYRNWRWKLELWRAGVKTDT